MYVPPAALPPGDSNPHWTASQRVFVPKNLQPGTWNSSFARPNTYNLHGSPNNLSSSSSPSTSNSPASTARSGFATRPRTKLRWSGNPQESENELPPTKSIRAASLDLDVDNHGDGITDIFGEHTGDISEQKADKSREKQQHANQEAVIVFGFPPGTTQAVLNHFGQFGEIVEKTPGVSLSAVECGRNWIRITYRDRESAQKALAQNGHIMPGQYVVGCVRSEFSEALSDDSSVHQSSTNSLLLDDEDVSMIEEHSMLAAPDTTSTSDTRAKNEKVLPDRIVPRSMNTQLFRSSAPKQREVQLTEQISTPNPEKPVPQGLLARAASAAANVLFGWDS